MRIESLELALRIRVGIGYTLLIVAGQDVQAGGNRAGATTVGNFPSIIDGC